MSRILRRARPFLSPLPSNDPCRAPRDLLRKGTEKFFLLFTACKRSSPDLSAYRFKENLSSVLVPEIIDDTHSLTAPKLGSTPSASAARNGSVFCAAQLNGEVSTSRFFEDLLHVLLTGFDVVHVNIENKDGCSTKMLQDPCHFRGFMILAHARPFLGWKLEPLSMPLDVFTSEHSPNSDSTSKRSSTPFCMHVDDISPFATEDGDRVWLPKTLMVPFSTHVEGSFAKGRTEFLLSHMSLRARFLDVLCANPLTWETFGVEGNLLGAPTGPGRASAAEQGWLRLLTGLRRMGVQPELITADVLLNATGKTGTSADSLDALTLAAGDAPSCASILSFFPLLQFLSSGSSLTKQIRSGVPE